MKTVSEILKEQGLLVGQATEQPIVYSDSEAVTMLAYRLREALAKAYSEACSQEPVPSGMPLAVFQGVCIGVAAGLGHQYLASAPPDRQHTGSLVADLIQRSTIVIDVTPVGPEKD